MTSTPKPTVGCTDVQELPEWAKRLRGLSDEIERARTDVEELARARKQFLYSLMNDDGLTITELAKGAGLSKARISTMLKQPTRKRRDATRKAIVDVLGEAGEKGMRISDIYLAVQKRLGHEIPRSSVGSYLRSDTTNDFEKVTTAIYRLRKE
jgi:hypothetical protein